MLPPNQRPFDGSYCQFLATLSFNRPGPSDGRTVKTLVSGTTGGHFMVQTLATLCFK